MFANNLLLSFKARSYSMLWSMLWLLISGQCWGQSTKIKIHKFEIYHQEKKLTEEKYTHEPALIDIKTIIHSYVFETENFVFFADTIKDMELSVQKSTDDKPYQYPAYLHLLRNNKHFYFYGYSKLNHVFYGLTDQSFTKIECARTDTSIIMNKPKEGVFLNGKAKFSKVQKEAMFVPYFSLCISTIYPMLVQSPARTITYKKTLILTYLPFKDKIDQIKSKLENYEISEKTQTINFSSFFFPDMH